MIHRPFLTVALPLLAAFAISGCMSVKDPRVATQTGSVDRSVTERPSILVVFQVHLETKTFLSRAPAHAEGLYRVAGAAFAKRIEALGGTVEYSVTSESTPPPIKPGAHSHLVVHKLTQVSVDGYGNTWNRSWDSSLFVLDKTPGSTQINRAFNQKYSSDGIRCFSGSQYANREACQVKYIDHLVAQVAPIFPAK